MKRITILACAVMCAALLGGCGRGDDRGAGHEHGHDHDHDHAGHTHHHNPPHGGTLVALGDHFAHLEVKVDEAAGKITVWVLDGEAAGAIRLSQPTIELTVKIPAGIAGTATPGTRVENFLLNAAASELTGEKAGDSSQFEIQHEALKGVKRCEITVRRLEVKGTTIEGLTFSYPEGKE